MSIITNENIMRLEIAMSESDSMGVLANFIRSRQSHDIFSSRIKAMP
jgi:hypothetical protein